MGRYAPAHSCQSRHFSDGVKILCLRFENDNICRKFLGKETNLIGPSYTVVCPKQHVSFRRFHRFYGKNIFMHQSFIVCTSVSSPQHNMICVNICLEVRLLVFQSNGIL